MKFLKSFPFLSSAVVQAVLALVDALGWHLTAIETGSIEAAAAAILALLVAPHVLPGVVPLFLGALTAIGALLVAFRVPGISSGEVSAIVAAVAAILGGLGHIAVKNKLLAAERAAQRQQAGRF